MDDSGGHGRRARTVGTIFRLTIEMFCNRLLFLISASYRYYNNKFGARLKYHCTQIALVCLKI